jgi:hypothetical protein
MHKNIILSNEYYSDFESKELSTFLARSSPKKKILIKTPDGSTVNFQAGLTCSGSNNIDVHGLLREREREEKGGGRGTCKMFRALPKYLLSNDNTFSKKLCR